MDKTVKFLKKPCNLAIVVVIVVFAIVGFSLTRSRPPLPPPKPKPLHELNMLQSQNENDPNKRVVIPTIIHQMWKDNKLPSDLVRWSDGCKQVNKEFDFRFYTDEDLKEFVIRNYPEYYEFYTSLKKGVYMADMARVLVIYHFGGIYMDLDFYCHRPFHCLINKIYHTHVVSKPHINNLMVVSLEPVIHAHVLRQKQRVVIQDFFMCTPKHPFLKWLLDDRLNEFKRQKELMLIDSSIQYTKDPFSFAIDKDIDRYHKYIHDMMIIAKGNMTKIHMNQNNKKNSDKLKVSIVNKPVDSNKSGKATTMKVNSTKVHHGKVSNTTKTKVLSTTNKMTNQTKSLKSAPKSSIKTVSLTNDKVLSIQNSHPKITNFTTKAEKIKAIQKSRGMHANHTKFHTNKMVSPTRLRKIDDMAITYTNTKYDIVDSSSTYTGRRRLSQQTEQTQQHSDTYASRVTSLHMYKFPFNHKLYYDRDLKTNVPIGYIVELPEYILHPLIDQTNEDLYAKCADLSHIPDIAMESCETVRRDDALRPSADTIAVHMWYHTYFKFNFIRAFRLFNKDTYHHVESRLPPTLSCEIG